MSTPPVTQSADDAWDDGSLGRDEQHVEVVTATADLEDRINEACDLQPISIRLEKSLIQDFKNIAALNNMGYQPLMRQALRRFAECEMKRIINDFVVEKVREEREVIAHAAAEAAKGDGSKPAVKPAGRRKAA